MKMKRVAAHSREFIVGLLILAAAGMIILGLLLFGGTHTQAAPAEVSYKYYTNIQVQQGDTLWTIAQSHMTEEYADINDYIQEVRSINHILDDTIKCGQYITIPYYSGEYLH